MYLARHVGGWSYLKISRFYNDGHYTTVIAASRNIEGLRKEDESVDALLDMLTFALSLETALREREASKSKWRRLIVDAIAERVCGHDRIRDASLGRSLRSDSRACEDLPARRM